MNEKNRIMNLSRRNFLRIGSTAALLGPVISAQPFEMADSEVADRETLVSSNRDQKLWVENGQPIAVIVTADHPSAIATYAAKELVQHIQIATKATLPILNESQVATTQSTKIYIGQTRAAQSVRIGHLPPEHCVLRSDGSNLYVVGSEGPGHPLDFSNVNSGTLWGVYEVLERLLQARWLWPGEGGIAVSKQTSLFAPQWDETIKPRLSERIIRTYVPWNWETETPVIYSFTESGQQSGMAYSSDDALKRYLWDQQVFLRRHRMGTSQNPSHVVGHTFTNWWQEYGETHPEWFQLIPVEEGEFAGKPQQVRAQLAYGKPEGTWKGKRGPDDPQSLLSSMCVSNEGLHHEIIRRWQAERSKNPEKDIPVQLGEDDIWGLCVCDRCVAWDAEQLPADEIRKLPGSVPGLHFPFNAGRRYAEFYRTIYDLACEIDPTAKVLGFIYLNYFVAPKDLQLHPNIILTFCPWGGFWYPRDPREQQWLRDQWQQWRALGATIMYRPNFLLDGGSMPLNYMHQMIDQFDFYLKNVCIATDFDARVGQWSAQGATMYALLRKHTRPDMNVDELLEEYYSAFGPAAKHVKAYFDFWEAHAIASQSSIAGAMTRNQATNLLTYARAASESFPKKTLIHAEQILRTAKEVVGNQQPFHDRVEYLHLGLTHALKVAQVSAAFADKNVSNSERDAALKDLSDFRRKTENLHVANYAASAADEVRSFSDRHDFQVQPDSLGNPADHE